MLNHLGTKTLETERLILKKDELGEEEIIWNNMFSDKDAAMVCNWKNFENKDEFFKMFKNNTNLPNNVYAWTIWEKASKLPIGGISAHHQDDEKLTCKIGYSIHPKWQNKGYCTEALIKVLDFLINEVGYEKVITECVLTNVSSRKVMEKAGMNYEGIITDETGKEVYSYAYSKILNNKL